MRKLIISALILFALACSSQSLEAIKISQESGMTILANFTDSVANAANATNQSDLNATINQNITNQNQTGQNQTSQTQANIKAAKATDTPTGLWSWGKIPVGYELNENGSLTKLANEEWKPSI